MEVIMRSIRVAFLFPLLFLSFQANALAQMCVVDPAALPPGTPRTACPSQTGPGSPCTCPNATGGTFPGHTEATLTPLNYSAVGLQAQQKGVQCAQESAGNINTFVQCAGGQVILPEGAQVMIDCAAQSGGNTGNFAVCAGANLAGLNAEQQIAVQCVIETQGQPYAAAGCTATRLTQRELIKCLTDGIGGPNGCFGDNNDLFGSNGWTARTFQSVVSDIQNGPGPTNDLVGADGFVVRKKEDIINDIRNGPGPNNDLVGCNGWVNRTLGGGCN
jgi:hypothetical protein